MKLSRKLTAVEIFIKLSCWARGVCAIFRRATRSVCRLRLVFSVKLFNCFLDKTGRKPVFLWGGRANLQVDLKQWKGY